MDVGAVIDLRQFLDRERRPMLVLVDLQADLHGRGADEASITVPQGDVAAVSRCAAALQHARARGYGVAFVRRARGHGSRAPRWLGGFRPWGSEMIFDRQQASCYESPRFAAAIADAGGRFVLAGPCGETCLATAADAFRRGHRATFLHDASTNCAVGAGAGTAHAAVCGAIARYGDVVSTGGWIKATSRAGHYRGTGYARDTTNQAS